MVDTRGFWTLGLNTTRGGQPWTIDEHDTSQCIGRGVGF